jgi:hypothetical protein
MIHDDACLLSSTTVTNIALRPVLTVAEVSRAALCPLLNFSEFSYLTISSRTIKKHELRINMRFSLRDSAKGILLHILITPLVPTRTTKSGEQFEVKPSGVRSILLDFAKIKLLTTQKAFSPIRRMFHDANSM